MEVFASPSKRQKTEASLLQQQVEGSTEAEDKDILLYVKPELLSPLKDDVAAIREGLTDASNRPSSSFASMPLSQKLKAMRQSPDKPKRVISTPTRMLTSPFKIPRFIAGAVTSPSKTPTHSSSSSSTHATTTSDGNSTVSCEEKNGTGDLSSPDSGVARVAADPGEPESGPLDP
eukprot:CAMPEP_0175098654 /NCGR_PEP_ID=MMETSP0086_2-20121207/5985_1 /TAXON_ID=136419 /ORGANISM="Unknown Unknown, Strain D1" /LENGTH=174 /DNA_ID=CAMNT_0016372345 /DNA_START=69 /DNA_END=594 /DNA_ORIENTATION=-